MNMIGNPRTVWQHTPASLLFVMVLLASNLASADDSPMLYFFTSNGCAPCIQVKHVVEQLDGEGYPVTTVNVDERPDWANAFRVTRTPTLALVRNNEVLAYQPRAMRAEELRGWFRSIQYAPTTRDAPQKSTDFAKSAPAKRASSNSQVKLRPAQTKVTLASSKSGSTFSSPTMHHGTSNPRNEFESTALSSTVRLQVEDEQGTSYATGTVIHTHDGESLVLTCGHVFRESKGLGNIVAEFGFADGATFKVPGQMLDYDSNANDIALVVIQNGNHRLESVDVAPAESSIERGDNVFTLGCDNGDDPTIRNTAIKNLARYDGSLKYDIFGRPVNGRSGGGMFNSKGQLIGVCNAAAVEVDEGIYTALETVHWQLAKTNLEHLFKSSPAEVDPARTAVASNTFQRQPITPSGTMVPIRRQPAATPREAPGATSPRASLASRVNNVSFEQPVNSSSDREVVITVRSKSNPLDSKTITISDPTPKLLDYLGSMEGEESRTLKMAQYRQWR